MFYFIALFLKTIKHLRLMCHNGNFEKRRSPELSLLLAFLSSKMASGCNFIFTVMFNLILSQVYIVKILILS